MERYSEVHRTTPSDAKLDKALHLRIAKALENELGADVGEFTRLVFKYRARIEDDVDVAQANSAVSAFGATVFSHNGCAYVEVPKQLHRRWARTGKWIMWLGIVVLLVSAGLVVHRLVQRGRI